MSDVMERYFKIVSGLRRENAVRLETVDWLLDDSESQRGSGRSLLMALAFVRKAAMEPGRWIKVWDHFDPSRGRNLMTNAIQSRFPSGVKFGVDGVQVHQGWAPQIFDKMSGLVYDMRRLREEPATMAGVRQSGLPTGYGEVLKDVKMAAVAAVLLGAPPEEVIETVKEAVVRCVMES